MEYRNLGKSGLQISALSFGSWITFGQQISDSTAENLMSAAYEAGINFFDTAEIYANGQAEKVMGNILKKMNWDRSSYLIASKVFFGDGGEKPNQTGLSRKHIREACDSILKRLQLDYVDVLYCHRPDRKTPLEETVWAMNLLIQQGKILYWGTSEWSAAQIMSAHYIAEKNNLIGPIVEQPQYNMLHRDRVEVEYQICYDQVGIGTTTWSPLASGSITDKYIQSQEAEGRLNMPNMQWLKERALTEQRLSKIKALNELAADLGYSLAQLGIAWCLKNPNVSSVILGASKEAHLQENIKALELLPSLAAAEVNQKIEVILENLPKQPPF